MGKYKINSYRRSVKSLRLASKKLLKTLTNKHKSHVNFIRNSEAYHWLDPRNYKGLERTLHSVGLLVMTGLILFSALSPLVDIYVTHKYYSLNSSTSAIVGSVSDSLAKQITYDNSKDAYVFNAAGMTESTQTVGPDKVPLSLLQAKVGGGNDKSKSLYAVAMPTDSKQGVTYYDSNTGLSFQIVPNFTQMSAKEIDNHVVYPINSDLQMVYSVKNNGLKEDIVLKQSVGDSFSYSYSLKLPQTLEARMLTDGSNSLGIYSADPALFTHSTYGADYDPAKIESAQLHAAKDHLVFAIPAPVIKQAGQSGQGSANASFALSNDGLTLTVSANHLTGLHYPVSVDPTVVIANTADFSTGNNEGNISYTGQQLSRANLTGGSISAGWTGTTVLPVATAYATSVTYNGYVYEIGGNAPTTTSVYYAPINSNGTIGAWTATTSLPITTNGATSVAYNGYVYEVGGYNGTAILNTVYYAPINANGTIGAWTATTALPSVTAYATSVAYSGYLYEIGGYNGTAFLNTVYYVPINANGTIGAWTATTALPTTTTDATSVAYNGYIYEIGGTTGSLTTTVSYVPINANGTIGAWTATTALPTATRYATSVAYNGYIYEIGGNTGSTTSTVDYAPINANGTIGAWTATTSLPIATSGTTSVAYNGYIYEIGGYNGSAAVATVNYAKIDSVTPVGTTSTYTATTALPTTTQDSGSVAYNGYIYEIGGWNTGTGTAVEYALINADGTIGAWVATTALPVGPSNATSVAYNGYLYELGGWIGSYSATVYYAVINSNGTIGSWTTTTALTTVIANATSVVYNGYIYEIGGYNGTAYATVSYALINSNGTIGTWSTTTSLPATRYNAASVVYNGYLYEIGGAYYNTVYYAPINSNGTVGTWAATTILPVSSGYNTSVVYNGYLYEIGGYNGSYLSNVYYSPINTNGTIGVWTASPSLPTADYRATSVVYNGYLYEIGGNNGSATLATVYYAQINIGGSATVGAWTATTALPAATGWANSVAYNGYVYEVGGYNGSTNSAVVDYAPINASGTIGAWTAITSLPVATREATSVVYNGYLYEIGGWDGTTNFTTVEFAPINANGTIGVWTATTALPTGGRVATSVAYNGYLYEIAPYTSASTAIVEFAPINANGTIGAWTATTSLPVATYYATSVVYNGYLYEIGGVNPSATAVIDYAPINTDGTIGAWTATNSLPTATYLATSIAYNGYLYEIGGTTGTLTSTITYAPIQANGSIGIWTTTTSLLAATSNATSVVYNGYLYEIGGTTGSATANVSYAPLNVMPRIGHYSKLFNFGSLITPVSILYNGSLPNAYGLSSIQYRTAGANGVFGSSQYITALSGTSVACTTVGTVQYMEVFVTLDDSGSAVIPDTSSTPANSSGITVSYSTIHAPPNLRLRGGAFFSSNVLQPLDTCDLVQTVSRVVTGGNRTQDATYTYRTFLSSGTLVVANGTITADALIIAGGGGGYNGGGGAGGLLYASSMQLTPGSYTVTVGGGGGNFTNGTNSSFNSQIAIGGGAGGYGTGLAGGSGGGAYNAVGGSGTVGQGHDGISGSGVGGGGGGAGSIGSTWNGGVGSNAYSGWATVTGTGVGGYYAGGGGGYSAGAGGLGGGGAAFSPGVANTGGGAGNGNSSGGGSGIIIIRYTRVQVGG